MKYRYKIVAIISPLVFVLDQLTKWLVISTLPLGEKIAIIPGFFEIVHMQNKGAAFGMLAGIESSFRVPFFYGVAAIAVIAMTLMLWKMRDEERLLPLTFALIFGGIAGNILDRIRLGVVTDFISLHWKDAVFSAEVYGFSIRLPLDWPAFNIADSAITIAMVLLIIAAFRKPKVKSI